METSILREQTRWYKHLSVAGIASSPWCILTYPYLYRYKAGILAKKQQDSRLRGNGIEFFLDLPDPTISV
jgi:hypothetical protein